MEEKPKEKKEINEKELTYDLQLLIEKYGIATINRKMNQFNKEEKLKKKKKN